MHQPQDLVELRSNVYDFRFLASAVPEREMAGVMHAINRNSNIDTQSVNCPLIPKAFHTSCLPPKCALRVHGLRYQIIYRSREVSASSVLHNCRGSTLIKVRPEMERSTLLYRALHPGPAEKWATLIYPRAARKYFQYVTHSLKDC